MKPLEQRPNIVQLNESEKDALRIGQWEEIQRLRARLKELEGQLTKDSRTSSKAPSSVGAKTPKHTGSQHQASANPPGGQVDHAPQGLALVEQPDHIMWYTPNHCEQCGEDLATQAGRDYEGRQGVGTLQTMRQRCAQRCAPLIGAIRTDRKHGLKVINSLHGSLPDNLGHPLRRYSLNEGTE